MAGIHARGEQAFCQAVANPRLAKSIVTLRPLARLEELNSGASVIIAFFGARRTASTQLSILQGSMSTCLL